MRRIITLVVCTLVLTLCAGAAFAASTYTDTMKVDYFINNDTSGAPYAYLQLTNTGFSGGNVCADIFVFNQYEEIQECCSCLLTPNGLRTISLYSLTDNTLTGVDVYTGSLRVVSAKTNASGYCPLPTTDITPVSSAIRTWSTHIQSGPSSGYFSITETAGQDAPLSSAELGALQNECYAIGLDGSGAGQCYCGSGD